LFYLLDAGPCPGPLATVPGRHHNGAVQALVIGGGSGIGAAVAAAHRARGDHTVVWDVAGERDVDCDISQPEAIEAVLAGVGPGQLPTWVTITAGVGHSGLLDEASAEDWDRVMAINARGPWLCMRGLANALRAAGQPASMVATSSVSAQLVDRSMGIYCASKAALSMLVQVAAAEWGPDNIRVNAVAPGVTATPMLGLPTDSPWLKDVADRTALGRVGTAEDIASAVLALHAAPWVTGHVLRCDGGLSLRSPIDVYGAFDPRSMGLPS
jgi:NAD(P)-dependent dehydrogenase (short-subunit alcohol dehydrogenase family)